MTLSSLQRFKKVFVGSRATGSGEGARESSLLVGKDGESRKKVLRDLGVLGLVTMGLGLLFLNKAFNIDDPLFLWLGRHIESHPLDFFGFQVNWYGTKTPMHEVTQNPPLSGYYLAICGALFGRNEISLHAAYLIPTLLAVFGIYALSRRLCNSPLLSTLISIFTPAFLVSATSVMCDIPMLALWVWAVVLWIRGMDQDRWTSLAGAVFLASLACLTKYFGITLVPLLLAYGLARKKRVGPWVGWLAVPGVVLVGYELLTIQLYGHGLFSGATNYAQTVKAASASSTLGSACVGLMFLGGCFPHAAFFFPQLWSAKTVGCVFGVLTLGLVAAGAGLLEPYRELIWMRTESSVLFVLHAGVFLLGGLSLCALAIVDTRRRRTPEVLLLLLWVFGTFLFASFVNWVNNARSNLPIAPVVGILIVRQLERTSLPDARRLKRFALSFLPGALLALLVTYGDYVWAGSIRDTARTLVQELTPPGKTLNFQGHWGFQYYMESHGIEVMDVREAVLDAGDLIVTPTNNAHMYPPPKQIAERVRRISVPEPAWIRTCSNPEGAGFYASNIGALPYVIGQSTPDVYNVYEIRRRFRYEVTVDGRKPEDTRKE